MTTPLVALDRLQFQDVSYNDITVPLLAAGSFWMDGRFHYFHVRQDGEVVEVIPIQRIKKPDPVYEITPEMRDALVRRYRVWDAMGRH